MFLYKIDKNTVLYDSQYYFIILTDTCVSQYRNARIDSMLLDKYYHFNHNEFVRGYDINTYLQVMAQKRILENDNV